MSLAAAMAVYSYSITLLARPWRRRPPLGPCLSGREPLTQLTRRGSDASPRRARNEPTAPSPLAPGRGARKTSRYRSRRAVAVPIVRRRRRPRRPTRRRRRLRDRNRPRRARAPRRRSTGAAPAPHGPASRGRSRWPTPLPLSITARAGGLPDRAAPTHRPAALQAVNPKLRLAVSE